MLDRWLHDTRPSIRPQLTFKKYNFFAPSGSRVSIHALWTQALAPAGVTEMMLVPVGIAVTVQPVSSGYLRGVEYLQALFYQLPHT